MKPSVVGVQQFRHIVLVSIPSSRLILDNYPVFFLAARKKKTMSYLKFGDFDSSVKLPEGIFPDAPRMEYLPTFTPKMTHM